MQTMLPQLQKMQEYFASRITYDYHFRKQQLLKLKEALYQYENEIYTALYADLKKNPEECWVTEIGFVIAEITYALKNLRKWMKPLNVNTNLINFPGKSYILNEPLGVVLIIGPWNYPLQLLLAPLVGAIAAGNCAVLKPSEFAPATASILKKILQKVFDPACVTTVEGEGATTIPSMMSDFKFDHIFYTGSTQVGRIIYEMAAKKLIPVTLELGGKSPCIVESDADVTVSAKRIALTKFSNAGQMCVAPDYLLVHEKVKDDFLIQLKQAIERFYMLETDGDNYGKIINQKQFDRLVKYLDSGKVLMGGQYNAEKLFFAPTIITDVDMEAPIMQEEIFGPLLPVFFWSHENEVYEIINRHKNPLALYVFSGNKIKVEKWTRTIAFGGGCINNASWHLTNHNLPFGGRGNSGTGNYHGKFSFDTFSHKKGILKTPTWFDPKIKYPPFKGKLNLFKRIFK